MYRVNLFDLNFGASSWLKHNRKESNGRFFPLLHSDSFSWLLLWGLQPRLRWFVGPTSHLVFVRQANKYWIYPYRLHNTWRRIGKRYAYSLVHWKNHGYTRQGSRKVFWRLGLGLHLAPPMLNLKLWHHFGAPYAPAAPPRPGRSPYSSAPGNGPDTRRTQTTTPCRPAKQRKDNEHYKERGK